jgi:hypothetical protein
MQMALANNEVGHVAESPIGAGLFAFAYKDQLLQRSNCTFIQL